VSHYPPPAFVDQLLDFQPAERLAFAEVFELGDRFAELQRAGMLYGHQPGNRRAVSGDRNLLAGCNAIELASEMSFGLEGPY